MIDWCWNEWIFAIWYFHAFTASINTYRSKLAVTMEIENSLWLRIDVEHWFIVRIVHYKYTMHLIAKQIAIADNFHSFLFYVWYKPTPFNVKILEKVVIVICPTVVLLRSIFQRIQILAAHIFISGLWNTWFVCSEPLLLIIFKLCFHWFRVKMSF